MTAGADAHRERLLAEYRRRTGRARPEDVPPEGRLRGGRMTGKMYRGGGERRREERDDDERDD